MDELGDSLAGMSFVQLVLLFAFVISYMLAVGGLLGTRARWRAATLALGLAVAFAALTRPWVHGALLMAFVVAGLGLFVLVAWLLAGLFGSQGLAPQRNGPAPAQAAADSVRAEAADTATVEAAHKVPLSLKLRPRRARSRS